MKKNKNTAPTVENRPVDRYFLELNQASRSKTHRIIQYVFLPMFFFSALCLIWMIPFPEIAFLKKHGYDTFLNWASFFIAGVLYFYLRLAPTLSYAVLFTFGVLSYFIVQLEYVEQAGGPAVWLVSLIALLISFFVLWLGKNLEKQPMAGSTFGRSLLLGPIWVWHFVFKALKIPY